MRLLVLLSIIATAWAGSHTFITVNDCSYTVWVGALGGAGAQIPNNGGWELKPGDSYTFTLPDGWSGRFWGRSNCTFDSTGKGSCVTGDCGGKLQCNGAGGKPPATLAEFTLAGFGGQDFFDVSLVDGYNLPMQIVPIPGTYQNHSTSIYDCGVAGCLADLNANCPTVLQQTYLGKVVACLSACEKFNTPAYCCQAPNGTSANCKPSRWPVNYAAVFKTACPTAYSYAYDDPTSTFTCHAPSGQTAVDTGYQISFCWNGKPPKPHPSAASHTHTHTHSPLIKALHLLLPVAAALFPVVF